MESRTNVTLQQDSKITNMGQWNNGIWQWNFQWRRQLFAWEDDLIHEMMQIINHYNSMEGLDDT